MEILKVKLNETQALIAYFHHAKDDNRVVFKVGPDSGGKFPDCSPDAAMALLAMLDRQEKPPTP